MYLYLCKRLHLVGSCLCCFSDMHLYSNDLSTTVTISSLIKSEILPACFSCKFSSDLSHSSSPSDDKKIATQTPEAIILGDLSIFIKNLSFSCFLSNIKIHFFSRLTNQFSTLWFSMVNIEIIFS